MVANSVGILGLQGCIEPHINIFSNLGASAIRVREPEDLKKIDRILLPGGESTTMLTLLARTGLEQPLGDFLKSHPSWGICAGAILLAKKVSNPSQRSFGAIDIHAIRNAYGSQLDSFKAKVKIPSLNIEPEVDFIRAPKLEALNDSVQVLAKSGDDGVLFKQGLTLASSFHIELSTESKLHKYFLEIA